MRGVINVQLDCIFTTQLSNLSGDSFNVKNPYDLLH